jgi:hypothetical protein
MTRFQKRNALRKRVFFSSQVKVVPVFSEQALPIWVMCKGM